MTDQPAPEGRTPAPRTPLDALVDALYEDGCLPPPRTDHTLHVIASLQRQGFAIEAAAGVRVAEPEVCTACGDKITNDGFGYFHDVDERPVHDHKPVPAAQPQPESGSAGTSGALREALEGLLAAQEQMLGDPDRRFRGPQAKATRKARAALAAAAEPKP